MHTSSVLNLQRPTPPPPAAVPSRVQLFLAVSSRLHPSQQSPAVLSRPQPSPALSSRPQLYPDVRCPQPSPSLQPFPTVSRCSQLFPAIPNNLQLCSPVTLFSCPASSSQRESHPLPGRATSPLLIASFPFGSTCGRPRPEISINYRWRRHSKTSRSITPC